MKQSGGYRNEMSATIDETEIPGRGKGLRFVAAAFPAAAAGTGRIYHSVAIDIDCMPHPLAERLGEESVARLTGSLRDLLLDARSQGRYSRKSSMRIYFRHLEKGGTIL
jgi:hypothetical protein